MNEKEKKELKNLLEDTAKESGLKVIGELAELKSPEQRQAEEEYENWKHKKTEKIIKSSKTELYKDYLELVLNGKINSLICISKAGYGKTYTTINFLKEMKKDFVYKSGYTTPLSFYHFLYENREKIIVLDDLTDNIFKDKKMIATLKSCLYEAGGERFVSYETTAESLKVPNKFKFSGKIILLANTVGRNSEENFKALVSRGIFFELKYPFKEILSIAKKILISKGLKKADNEQIIGIIENNICEVSEFNFRQLEQLIQMVEFNPKKAETLFVNSFHQDEELILVSKLMGLSIPVSEQAQRFKEETGCSTRKYYRIKRRIKNDNP